MTNPREGPQLEKRINWAILSKSIDFEKMSNLRKKKGGKNQEFLGKNW